MSGCEPSSSLTNWSSRASKIDPRVVPRAELVYPAYSLYFATCFKTFHRLVYFYLKFSLKLPFRKNNL